MEVPLLVSSATTMWRAWLGFNAGQSVGLLLFGAVYGYLALARSAWLFDSPYLTSVGLLFLLSYTVLARLYFFSVPFAGLLVATVLYAAALLVVVARGGVASS